MLPSRHENLGMGNIRRDRPEGVATAEAEGFVDRNRAAHVDRCMNEDPPAPGFLDFREHGMHQGATDPTAAKPRIDVELVQFCTRRIEGIEGEASGRRALPSGDEQPGTGKAVFGGQGFRRFPMIEADDQLRIHAIGGDLLGVPCTQRAAERRGGLELCDAICDG
jgi:hypothetical protein